MSSLEAVMQTGVKAKAQHAAEEPAHVRRLREVTGQVVGSVFFAELFRSMRKSPLKGAFGHGGRGEEVFSAQLHGVLAERMGTAMPGGVADAVFESLRPQQQRIARLHGTT